MKHLARLLSLLILVSGGSFLASCGGGSGGEKSAEEVEFNKLKGEWTLQNGTATFTDGSNEVRAFPGMKLNLSGTFSAGAEYSYNVTVTDPVIASPWPAAGKWKFASATPPTSGITRLDSKIDPTFANIPLNYSLSNSDKTLTITFDFSGNGFALNGRTESVNGDWEFIFTRP